MMTYDEYRQLTAYARYDGIYLAVLWIAAFACLIGCSAYQPLSMLCILLLLSTPLFVAYRLRLFRQEGLGDRISFGRALHYCLRMFLNAAVLFAIAQWAYMQYIDHGRLAAFFRTMMTTEESQETLRQMGMDGQALVSAFEQITPLEFASSYLIENVLVGAVFSVVIAAAMKKG